jgi:hypothetical protein
MSCGTCNLVYVDDGGAFCRVSGGGANPSAQECRRNEEVSLCRAFMRFAR